VSRGGIWRSRLVLWVPPLVFFALNLAFFSTYRLVYADRMDAKRDDLQEREARLESLQGESEDLSRFVATARDSRDRMRELYRDRLSTQRQRFTAVTSEVQDLARRAGLEPAAMSYPSEEIEDYGLEKRYFTFNVEGTYVELRRFINLLELTPSFITLERVRLSGGEGARLAIQLNLSTLFVEEDRMPDLGAEEKAP
jgi:hypothetical protein